MTTQDYINKEEARQRKPCELYHIWSGSTHYRHTNGDVAVVYGGYTWTPATIQRDTISFNSDLSASTVNVLFAKTNPAISKYIARTPTVLSRIKIYSLFRDQSPAETMLRFFGQISTASIKGSQAQGKCIGIEYQLQYPLLKNWYQPECNHTLFDSNCGLNKASYGVSAQVTVSSDETVLTASAFGAQSNGYWTLGYVSFGDGETLIVDHTGNDISIMFPIDGLVDGNTVTVYPGCDGNVDTCKDKYSNLSNFFGFPVIPIDNPAVWVGKE